MAPLITLLAWSLALAVLVLAPVPFQFPTEPVAEPNGPEALSNPLADFEFAPVPFQLNTLPVAFWNGPLALSTAKAFLGAPGLARCQARIASLAAFKFPLALLQQFA